MTNFEKDQIKLDREIRSNSVQSVDVYQDSNKADIQIDSIELLKQIYDNRYTLFKIVGLFFLIGVIIAFMTPNEYASSVKLLPETQGQTSNLGRLGGLAAQFGLGGASNSVGTDVLPVQIYPEILTSIDFLHEIITRNVFYASINDSITIQEYYNEYYKSNQITKYTVGLPFQIIGWFRPKSEPTDLPDWSNEPYKRIIPNELSAISGLRQSISNDRDLQNGILTISVTTQSPEISAQITVFVTERLSEYLTTYRTEKSRQNLNFIEKRHEEAKLKFEEEQSKLATFRDQNQGNLTASARSNEQNLQNEYNLAFSVFSSLSEQLEQARIKLQTETPVINVLQEPLYPTSKSRPNRISFIIGYVFVGFVFAVTFLLLKQPFRNVIHTIRNKDD
ncbi:MAG TPA: hypothetical protein DCE78_08570 [Bacteroidetes bacterium]|nr:hypothetical protein [Bacteroidota bacterium]